MDKYGVELDDSLNKEASIKKGVCPKCGNALLKTTPPICPECGSRYLEKEEEKDNG